MASGNIGYEPRRLPCELPTRVAAPHIFQAAWNGICRFPSSTKQNNCQLAWMPGVYFRRLRCRAANTLKAPPFPA